MGTILKQCVDGFTAKCNKKGDHESFVLPSARMLVRLTVFCCSTFRTFGSWWRLKVLNGQIYFLHVETLLRRQRRPSRILDAISLEQDRTKIFYMIIQPSSFLSSLRAISSAPNITSPRSLACSAVVPPSRCKIKTPEF